MHEEEHQEASRKSLQIRCGLDFWYCSVDVMDRQLSSLVISTVDLAIKVFYTLTTGVRVALVVPFSLLPTFGQDTISQHFVLYC